MAFITIKNFVCPHCGNEVEIHEYGRMLQVRYVTGAYDDGYDYSDDIESYDLESEVLDDYSYELERYVCGTCDATLAGSDADMIKLLIKNGHLKSKVKSKEIVNTIKEV